MAKKGDQNLFGPQEDPFVLGKVLASGSQGEVLLCTQRATGKKYAVKRIDTGKMKMRRNSGNVEKNLRREIQIMRELTHVRIVNLIEAFWEKDVCFIVMDYASGGSLNDKLEPDVGIGSEKIAKHVSMQILEGIAYMHQNSIVHRDLKPDNILVSKQKKGKKLFNVKIADFGLSRLLNEAGGRAANMTAVGTPVFVAPEVLSGNYGEPADFWSFGCIIYTMICGSYPFDDTPAHFKNPKDVKILPHAKFATAPPLAKELIEALLEADTEKRFNLHRCRQCEWLTPDEDEFEDEGAARMQTMSNTPAVRKQIKCLDGIVYLFKGKPQAAVVKMPTFGVIRTLSGWTGSSVDSVELELTAVFLADVGVVGGRRGSKQSVDIGVSSRRSAADEERRLCYPTQGKTAGVYQKKVTLDPDELVIAVSQEFAENTYLGHALIFYTSKSRVVGFTGTSAARKSRFAAPPDSQIVGLQFDNYRLVGIHLANIGGKESVREIAGCVGYAVDSVEFVMIDGLEKKYGGRGGSERVSWSLDKDEYIVIVEQGRREPYLGYSMVFFTSTGKVLQLRGVDASRSKRVMVPRGRQLCGLSFDNAGRLDGIETTEAVVGEGEARAGIVEQQIEKNIVPGKRIKMEQRDTDQFAEASPASPVLTSQTNASAPSGDDDMPRRDRSESVFSRGESTAEQWNGSSS
jgi:serine/threonine protein kinase